MWTTAYYNFWEYWELRHKVTFDGPNKYILINDGETDIAIKRDIYSAWKEWAKTEVNLKYLQALNTVGGEPTFGSQSLDVTYFLVNGWKIKPYPGSYDLTLDGNIFDVDGGDIKVPADLDENKPNNITITRNTSVIVRQVAGTSATSSQFVTASLEGAQEQALYDISGSVVSIENILSSPLTASLVQDQQDALYNIEAKLLEIYQLHGLESGSALTVTQTERSFAAVSQSIATTGTGSSQETVITRL